MYTKNRFVWVLNVFTFSLSMVLNLGFDTKRDIVFFEYSVFTECGVHYCGRERVGETVLSHITNPFKEYNGKNVNRFISEIVKQIYRQFNPHIVSQFEFSPFYSINYTIEASVLILYNSKKIFNFLRLVSHTIKYQKNTKKNNY